MLGSNIKVKLPAIVFKSKDHVNTTTENNVSFKQKNNLIPNADSALKTTSKDDHTKQLHQLNSSFKTTRDLAKSMLASTVASAALLVASPTYAQQPVSSNIIDKSTEDVHLVSIKAKQNNKSNFKPGSYELNDAKARKLLNKLFKDDERFSSQLSYNVVANHPKGSMGLYLPSSNKIIINLNAVNKAADRMQVSAKPLAKLAIVQELAQRLTQRKFGNTISNELHEVIGDRISLGYDLKLAANIAMISAFENIKENSGYGEKNLATRIGTLKFFKSRHPETFSKFAAGKISNLNNPSSADKRNINQVYGELMYSITGTAGITSPQNFINTVDSKYGSNTGLGIYKSIYQEMKARSPI
jgi:hypothetical protein